MPAPPPETPESSRSVSPGPDGALAFTVDGRELGVPIGPVVEIVTHRGATPVPHARPAVEGILALRGRIITVVDGRRGLGLPPRRPCSAEQLTVIEPAADHLSLVVDSVTRVVGQPGEVTTSNRARRVKQI